LDRTGLFHSKHVIRDKRLLRLRRILSTDSSHPQTGKSF
jgi:hypothetical protein